jgi:hypothetical protein
MNDQPWGYRSNQPGMQGAPLDDLISKYLGPNWQQGLKTMAWARDIRAKTPDDNTWGQALGTVGSIIGSIIGSYYGGPIGGKLGGKAGSKIGGSWGTFADTGKAESLLQGF